MKTYGELIELMINEKAHFEDALSIILTSFSHKRPYSSGPTKATAHLTITNGTETQDLLLSVHGIEGKSEYQDGLTPSKRFDSLLWSEYKIQMEDFNYDKSIKIIVTKRGE
ncbi:MAG TPA: hypothetical protein PKL31_08500 [Fulvivirga sp.]|nr:hypothetical protein [Fulvivirga sp.]